MISLREFDSTMPSSVKLIELDSRIFTIRRQRVMLDSDLATIYGTSTARLNEQFKRNSKRFPDDFAFVLTREEFMHLISQNAISKQTGRGGRRKLPIVFTEHAEPSQKREIGFHVRAKSGHYRVTKNRKSKIEIQKSSNG